MKKIIIIMITLAMLVFNACSLQENMSPEIFFERLKNKADVFDFDNSEVLNDESGCVYFLKDFYGTEYVFEFILNDTGDINKISFACNEVDKAENYINYLKSIIDVYSPDESADEIINAISESGKLKSGFSYYDTQWHSWSSYSDGNGLFFSVANKKLIEQTTVELSLKPNDKVAF